MRANTNLCILFRSHKMHELFYENYRVHSFEKVKQNYVIEA